MPITHCLCPITMRHRSPGLTTIYNEVKSSRQNRVLDLGSMVADNFNFLSSLSCKIHFENLDEFIEENGQLSDDNLIFRLEKYLQEQKKTDKFDVILAWDLLNYLPLPVIHKLFTLLNSFCKPNTLLHTIKYLNGKIPTQPARFKILDQYLLEISSQQVSPRRIANHPTAALLKHIPQYYLHNNLMNEKGMASGIAEHVMRYTDDKSVRKQYVASAEIHSIQAHREAKNTVAPTKDRRQSAKANTGEAQFTSPAIESILALLERKNTILDLGYKSSQNMEFWREHFNNVYTEDLPSSLHWRNFANEAITDVRERPISDEALRFNTGFQFELIVLWDIFNFCTKDQIKAIGKRLLPYCKTDTRVLLLSYTGNDIPLQPQKYSLTEKGYYCLEAPKKGPRPIDPVTTAGVMKLIPGWVIEKTHVFSPGMKRGLGELVFRVI
ncbi:hypothetical protein SAMN02745866_00595 [Alteromonadaceae bacterium Bs31]|nr:hypothetical protein SAMN02745866_00595 [Alteromonadaceae bacterium Bs31]